MDELTKSDIGWIYAAKHNIMEEYYKREYPYGTNNPEKVTHGLIGNIVRWTLWRAQGWNEAVNHLFIERHMIEYHEGKHELTTTEFFYWGFYYWSMWLTTQDLDKLSPHWKIWWDETNKEYKDFVLEKRAGGRE
jgi:hypothetical protein